MGAIWAKMKRKKTNLEILENLENDIKSIEESRQMSEQMQRRIVGHLILCSIGVYVIATTIFYFFFFPANLKDQLFYIIPLLIFPVIVVLLRRLITWWYSRRISYSLKKLIAMKEEKKRLLEEVMDKETYKVAKKILEKFAPAEPVRISTVSSALTPAKISSLSTTGSSKISPSSVVVSTGSLPTNMEVRRRLNSAQPAGLAQQNGQTTSTVSPTLPRSIFPRDRNYLDKLVDYIVGDGPSNRYALICKNCCSHNGMALKEEFDFLSFRCCYCGHWNPARKQKPVAPRLPDPTRSDDIGDDQTSGSELESPSDTDSEGPVTSTPEKKTEGISEAAAEASEIEKPPTPSPAPECSGSNEDAKCNG